MAAAGYAPPMHLAFSLRRLSAAALAALVTVACGPKNPGDDTDTTAGTTDSTGAGGGSNTTASTNTQECTPGDVMPGEGDCSSCACSDAGQWQCNRCDPTTGAFDTTDATSAGTDATTDDATTTGPDTTGTTSATDDDTSGSSGGVSDGMPVCADLGQSDELLIDAAQIVDDTLVLAVGYGGGCETHEFTLCFGGFVLDTDFVQLGVHHDANGDACEAFITEEQKFDLTPVQGLGNSPLHILLDGWDTELQYDF